jgi:minor extracellular serine protease Vpr
MRKKGRFSLFVVSILFIVMLNLSFVQANLDGKSIGELDGKSEYYFVQLENESIVEKLKKQIKSPLTPDQLHSSFAKQYNDQLQKDHVEFKTWLKNMKKPITVTAEFSTLINGIAVKANSTDAKILAQGPGVKRVVQSRKYKPLMNQSNQIIRSQPLWKKGFQGDGMKVGVIDSGIDPHHPFLKDDSLKMPAGFPKVDRIKDRKYTSNKVIVAKVYSPDPTASPEAIDSHGTHVAGTIAGRSDYKDPTGIVKSRLSGVAPKAYLGNYNVFPCDNCSAESIFIAKAVEDAVNDGMDIINMSLGGEAIAGFDLLVEVVNAASDIGVTMVIAAGNEGPGPMTIASPGIASKAITVGAVTNNHFIGVAMNIEVDGQKREAQMGTSDPGGKITDRVAAPLAVVSEKDGLGCEPIDQDLQGKIAVLKRGTCTFTLKGKHAMDRGAVGLIIINNSVGDPSTMFVEEEVTIPMGMVSDQVGEWISRGNQLYGEFLPGSKKEVISGNSKYLANFSSRGPTVNYTLKPDVTAVGVNVYSSVLQGELEMLNGTSMATPHVAGAAALLKQAHPLWTPDEIKAALMSTAQPVRDSQNPLEIGSGLVHVEKAFQPSALLFPSSLSFGKIKSSMQTVKLKVRIVNPTNQRQTYLLSTKENDQIKISRSQLTLEPKQMGSFEVRTVPKNGRSEKEVMGYITIQTRAGESVRLPYYYHFQ